MIGNNSCGVHSVMAGRTADNVDALEVLTYDGAAPAPSGRQRRGGARALRRAPAGGAARSTRGLRDCATATPTRSARGFPDDPAPGLRLQPRRAAAGERLRRGPRAGRHRGHLRRSCSRRAAARAEPAERTLVVLGYPDVYRGRRPRAARCWSAARSASRASTTACSTYMKRQGPARASVASCCPKAAAGCSSSSAATTASEANAEGRAR